MVKLGPMTGDKVRFRDDDPGVILTGLVTGDDGATVTIETLEDPPRTFTRPAGQVVVIGSERPYQAMQ